MMVTIFINVIFINKLFNQNYKGANIMAIDNGDFVRVNFMILLMMKLHRKQEFLMKTKPTKQFLLLSVETTYCLQSKKQSLD